MISNRMRNDPWNSIQFHPSGYARFSSLLVTFLHRNVQYLYDDLFRLAHHQRVHFLGGMLYKHNQLYRLACHISYRLIHLLKFKTK